MQAKIAAVLLMLLGLLIAVGCQPAPPPKPVEMPVSRTPGRASNEEMVSAAPAGRASSLGGGSGAGADVATASSTQPSTKPTVTTKFGGEQFRLVSESDEIVSVLQNGMVVIVKRVPSPVLAVRGYVKTGGVFEGKWLGGGLSHLLEHLVAGKLAAPQRSAESRSPSAHRQQFQRLHHRRSHRLLHQ